jgi:hypothetical protein
VDLIQRHSIAILHQDCNLWFRLLVAIAKDLSNHHKTRDYMHGEPDFAMKGMYQMGISFTVADWQRVSLDLVQGKSLNSMLKLVL